METSVIGPAKPERIMWFSMWFLASMITFGLAFFPMFYRSIERRNLHFKRQYELEKKITALAVNNVGVPEVGENPPSDRNAVFLTLSILLVFPAFVILYLLSADLMLHEKNQRVFLKGIFPEMEYMPQRIGLGKYVVLTLVTLGIGGIYWLYRVVYLYNSHFREHRVIDDEICRWIEARSHGESV